jgi:hypothetical protein
MERPQSDKAIVSPAKVIMDGSGNATVGWSQSDGTANNTDIWANRYEVDKGWSARALIKSGTETGQGPAVAGNDAGDVMLVWSDDSHGSVWSSAYAKGGGWGTPVQVVGSGASQGQGVVAAMDGHGDVVAVFGRNGGRDYPSWASRYEAGHWDDPTLIGPNNNDGNGSAFWSRVSIDSAGNAVAIWAQETPHRSTRLYSMWANRYTVGSGWEAAALLETDEARGTSYCDVAIDESQHAVAVWLQDEGQRYDVWANRF